MSGLPRQIVEEAENKHEDGVASSSDVVEIPRRYERSTDAREPINRHQHHHPYGNCLYTPNSDGSILYDARVVHGLGRPAVGLGWVEYDKILYFLMIAQHTIAVRVQHL